MTLRSGELTARANGLDICYETFGDAAKPAVLLITALAGQMVHWEDAFCERLAERGLHVIRFDNRDSGKSSQIVVPALELMQAMLPRQPGQSPKAPYRLEDMAADAIGLLDALKIPAAHIVGLSLGGMIGQEMAILHPDRVLSLTTINATTNEPDLPPSSMGVGLIRNFKPTVTPSEFVQTHTEVIRAFRGPGFPEDEADDLALGERIARRNPGMVGGMNQMVAVMVAGPRKARLSRIAVPTVVVHGAEDKFVPVRAGEDSANAIPGAKLVIIEGMGHGLNRTMWPRLFDEIASLAK